MSKLSSFLIMGVYILHNIYCGMHSDMNEINIPMEMWDNVSVCKNGVKFTYMISGGYQASKLTYAPFMASIRTRTYTTSFGDNHFCCGVVISISIVLTAAHCVVDGQGITTRPNSLTVVLGGIYRLRKTKNILECKIKAIVPHPDFNRHTGNDIALLILSETINRRNPSIKIIPIASRKPPQGFPCSILGWGRLYPGGPYADLVSEIEMSIWPRVHCREYENYYDIICVYNENDSFKDICLGDSGAPLICENALVGIASYPTICGENFGAPFTDLEKHYSWIISFNEPNICHKITPSLFLLYCLLTQLIIK